MPYGPVPFLVTGGSGQYTFSETGLLPSGMSLSPAGILSGTPTQGGAFPFIVNVSDSQGDTGGLTQSLVINPAATTTTLDRDAQLARRKSAIHFDRNGSVQRDAGYKQQCGVL